MSGRLRTAALCALALAPALVTASGPVSVAAAESKESIAMSSNPSASRPPAPQVPPVDHKGVHYEQDMQSTQHGGSGLGGYLAAYDMASRRLLWTVKVYDVKDYSAERVGGIGLYFKSMKLVPGRDELMIENEAGGRYAVDLHTRNVIVVYKPGPKAPTPQKKLPTPPG